MKFEVRADRSPQGRRALHAERATYFELINIGYGFMEAARVVGVNYRTTKRWRSGNWSNNKKKAGTVTPVVARPYRPSLSSRFLSVDDRLYVADRVRVGTSLRQIARELNRPASTISREVRRNAHPVSGDYRPHAAHARAEGRRARPKQGKIAQNPELRGQIQGTLDLRWSPEQIARWLRREFPDRPEMHVIHETIYLALYVQGQG